MGHVDHGKTSLLDYIRRKRNTGIWRITQHIGGAYGVTLDSGQENYILRYTRSGIYTMRARGAQVTDIAIIVIAAMMISCHKQKRRSRTN
jgi:translation initiation factor IF-2